MKIVYVLHTQVSTRAEAYLITIQTSVDQGGTRYFRGHHFQFPLYSSAYKTWQSMHTEFNECPNYVVLC